MSNTKQVDTTLVGMQKSSYTTIDIESLLRPLGGMRKYVNAGERILLKTNLLAPSEPKKAVVTRPALVNAVAVAVLKAGGVPFIGDSPSGQFTKRRLEKSYQKAGLIELANNLGIELNYDTGVKKIMIPQGKKLKKTPYCDFVLNADKIIALPKIKTHSYMIMTLATKIMYGAIPGLTKAKYHSIFMRKAAFADMLLDVLSVRTSDLFIMDGITGMQGDGPSVGLPVDIGILLASEDAVAMDIAVCTMLGIEPIGIPVLRQAKLRGLWPTEIHYPLCSPQEVHYLGFQLPSTADYLLTGKKTPRRSPVPSEKCIACGQCVEICPKKAIQIISHKATVDYSKCIRCYCCAEICPYEAIKLEQIK